MDINTKFRPILSRVVTGWIQSVPICNQENECMFYYTLKKNENGYVSTNIEKIYSRRRSTGEVEELNVDAYDWNKIDEASLVVSNDNSVDFYELKQEYLKLYDSFCEFGYLDNIDNDKKNECRRMIDILNAYVTLPSLKKIYLTVGEEFFNYCYKKM